MLWLDIQILIDDDQTSTEVELLKTVRSEPA